MEVNGYKLLMLTPSGIRTWSNRKTGDLQVLGLNEANEAEKEFANALAEWNYYGRKWPQPAPGPDVRILSDEELERLLVDDFELLHMIL